MLCVPDNLVGWSQQSAAEHPQARPCRQTNREAAVRTSALGERLFVVVETTRRTVHALRLHQRRRTRARLTGGAGGGAAGAAATCCQLSVAARRCREQRHDDDDRRCQTPHVRTLVAAPDHCGRPAQSTTAGKCGRGGGDGAGPVRLLYVGAATRRQAGAAAGPPRLD
jgi:hypothetical protein